MRESEEQTYMCKALRESSDDVAVKSKGEGNKGGEKSIEGVRILLEEGSGTKRLESNSVVKLDISLAPDATLESFLSRMIVIPGLYTDSALEDRHNEEGGHAIVIVGALMQNACTHAYSSVQACANNVAIMPRRQSQAAWTLYYAPESTYHKEVQFSGKVAALHPFRPEFESS
ncbi:hypothetical protein VNO77_18339 [Canavalia gladiata]|uniref:Uncharacterized protein n=1 Tax=Canavalia gladiata TaxID=3824 RepID=A0AAN9LKM6_CANGL